MTAWSSPDADPLGDIQRLMAKNTPQAYRRVGPTVCPDCGGPKSEQAARCRKCAQERHRLRIVAGEIRPGGQPSPEEHGTQRGYNQHSNRGTELCVPCSRFSPAVKWRAMRRLAGEFPARFDELLAEERDAIA